MKINFFRWKCTVALGMLLCVTTGAFAQTRSIPYEGVPGWTESQDKRMQWFKEARFGLFIHWGLFIGEPSTRISLQAKEITGDALPEIAFITLIPLKQ